MTAEDPTPARRAPQGRVPRVLWLAGGCLCFAVGVIGVALPGVPTTGPMLLALACFARSSPRLHHWLLHHRVFGPPLQRWQQHHVIPLRAKILAVAMMLGSLAYVAGYSPLPPAAVIAVAVLVAVGIVVVLRLPHTVRDGRRDARGE